MSNASRVGVSSLQIRTIIVEGSLATRMRRAQAARANECGLQIMDFPQVAARLAGGFISAATVEQLDLAIQHALAEGAYVELESVRHLPGMTRAVVRTLRKVWNADIRLDIGSAGSVRIGELAQIEERIRRHLPDAVMLPVDLRDAALARIGHTARLVGPITIERISYIPPIWRRLLEAMCEEVPVEWHAEELATTGDVDVARWYGIDTISVAEDIVRRSSYRLTDEDDDAIASLA